MSGFDVVVVGSGAGGAPVGRGGGVGGVNGRRIEGGRAYQKTDFDRDEIEWSRRDRFVPSPQTDPHTRRNDEGQRAGLTTDGWISTVLGGGTVHMGAYLLRAHPDDAMQATRFAAAGEKAHSAIDWAVPFADIAAFYDRAEAELGVSGTGTLPFLSAHALSQHVDEAAKKMGLPSVPTPRGILSAARPEEDRLGCAYRQLCASYGCPNDAKNSMPATYIRRAQKTGNLTVWTRSLVEKILIDEGEAKKKRAKGVRVRKLDDGGMVDVDASIVVVAAGAIESARLLRLSGPAFNSRGQVGQNVWFSLFVEVGGFFERDKHKDVADLMTGSPFINRSLRPDGVLAAAEARAAKVDRSGMFQVSFVHDNPIHRAERIATETLDDGKLLWGSALKEQLRRQFRGGRQVILEGFGEMTPHLGSSIDLDPEVRDQFDLPVARITQWHHPRDKRVAKKMADDGIALLKAMGADDVKATKTLSSTMVLQGGTCRFGDDPSTSVTTRDGHLHDVDNVYVADGGSLPSSLTVPSTLTIVANSLRIAKGIKKRPR